MDCFLDLGVSKLKTLTYSPESELWMQTFVKSALSRTVFVKIVDRTKRGVNKIPQVLTGALLL